MNEKILNLNNSMRTGNSKNSTILVTIDVEDWFQVENFKQYIPFSTWSSRELRVEKNVHRILDLFDSIETRGQPSSPKGYAEPGKSEIRDQKYELNDRNLQQTTCDNHTKKVRATFFVLGWIAERFPNLVKEIHSRGHEIASHGYIHDLCYDCSDEDLRNDLSESKRLLEDIIGEQVFGYRAPSFSINNHILQIIEECGYLYDSSYNSFGIHDRYGHLEVDDFEKIGIALKCSDNFYELPVSNLQFSIPQFKIQNCILPWGGGGYFRLIPFFILKKGIASILKGKNAYMLYLHPWEIDPDQPRVKEASILFKFRHYVNLKKCETRLARMINTFRSNAFITCRQYIDKMSGII